MKERILQFLKEESLTAAKFADDIGVQRSSVSHILSGRNNPGFDFIQKMLKRYPHLNAEWLIMGTGTVVKPMQQASLFDLSAQPDNTNVGEMEETVIFSAERKSEPALPPSESQAAFSLPLTGKSEELPVNLSREEIEKIIIIYKDRTFREYLQRK